LGNLKERDNAGDVKEDGKRIILKWKLNHLNGRSRTGFIWLRIGTSSVVNMAMYSHGNILTC